MKKDDRQDRRDDRHREAKCCDKRERCCRESRIDKHHGDKETNRAQHVNSEVPSA